MGSISVARLDPSQARDHELVGRLTDLVNDVYAHAESGLWRDGFARITATELADLVRAGEIAAARHHHEVVGSVRIREIGHGRSEFGILAAAPAERGIGVGRALVDFAEADSWGRGSSVMQLELLVPRDWTHPSKEFLRAWYARRGYRRVGSGPMEQAYPQVTALLATPCDLEVHEKPLTDAGGPP